MITEHTGMALSPAFRLAGFALVQAAWSIEDGSQLVPIGLVEQDGERTSMRFATEITPERLVELYAIVAGNVEPGQHGVVGFSRSGRLPGGEPFFILNIHIVDDAGHLVGVVRQAYEPARMSWIPGRSTPFGIVGTPSPSEEIDVFGVREELLVGVMLHPEGERLFPQLAAFAVTLMETSRS
jgi:hypothetical protein